MSESSTGRELDPAQATNARYETLIAELIAASGQYGLRAEKLGKAETLLSLSAIRARADHDSLTYPVAAVELIRDAVDAWPDDLGRAILRSALAFDNRSSRSRPDRLDQLAAELNKRQPKGKKFSSTLLDSHFTTRLVPDLAAALLVGDRRLIGTPEASTTEIPDRRTSMWALGGVAALVILLGFATFLLLRNASPDELVFRPVPSRCSIDYCRDQARAIVAQTGGFTPGGVVRTEIFTPSGKNANDLGGLATYRSEKLIDEDGQFVWWYWWDPGMEIGTYHVRITDEETGRSVEADFEFYDVG